MTSFNKLPYIGILLLILVSYVLSKAIIDNDGYYIETCDPYWVDTHGNNHAYSENCKNIQGKEGTEGTEGTEGKDTQTITTGTEIPDASTVVNNTDSYNEKELEGEFGVMVKRIEEKYDNIAMTEAAKMALQIFPPKFVAGILGNIMHEAKTAQFENSNYKSNPNSIPCYLQCMNDNFNYKEKYSNNFITEIGITETKKLSDDVNSATGLKLKFTSTTAEKCTIGDGKYKVAGDSCEPKFGLGAVQWTDKDRRNNLLEEYEAFRISTNNNYPSKNDCAAIEARFIVKEINEKYNSVYKSWQDNATPYNAGSIICTNYEIPREKETEKVVRGNDAESIYKVMIGN